MALPRNARVAVVLWIVLAVLAWNVVFDRMIVVAARLYIVAAKDAARNTDQFLLIDDWMPKAVERAFWTASAVGSGIATFGLGAIAWAVRGRPASTQRIEDTAS